MPQASGCRIFIESIKMTVFMGLLTENFKITNPTQKYVLKKYHFCLVDNDFNWVNELLFFKRYFFAENLGCKLILVEKLCNRRRS
jgi:hypothetical protein